MLTEKAMCGMICTRMEIGEGPSLKKLGVVPVIPAVSGVCVCWGHSAIKHAIKGSPVRGCMARDSAGVERLERAYAPIPKFS